MDDSKLSQESNLTARQPHRAAITLYVSFNKRRLASEVLVNLAGIRGTNSGPPAPSAKMLPLGLLYGRPLPGKGGIWVGADGYCILYCIVFAYCIVLYTEALFIAVTCSS